MSAIANNLEGAKVYAALKVLKTHQTYKLYYRKSTDQYLVTSPESEIPLNSVYQGRWIWNGVKVEWIGINGYNNTT